MGAEQARRADQAFAVRVSQPARALPPGACAFTRCPQSADFRPHLARVRTCTLPRSLRALQYSRHRLSIVGKALELL